MGRARQRKSLDRHIDPQAPPEIRLVNRSAQRSSWRDPDDLSPSARRNPKEIIGWRASCLLRQMMHRNGASSNITEEHVLAADYLRLQVDAVLIGFSGRRELMPVQSVMYGPLAGPSAAALRSIRAWKPLQRALLLFTEAERRLLTWVALENRSVASWCAAQRELGRLVSNNRAMQTLVEVLDRLAAFYDVEGDRRGARAA